MTTIIPKQPCWKCGYKMDRSTEALGDHKPEKGDISMCISCGALAIFNADLTMRKPTQLEEVEIAHHPVVTQLQIYRASNVGDKLRRRK